MEFCQVDGLKVAYREAGTGPAVLLVHGWPTSSYLWRNVLPAIAEHNRVVAVDLPGFGESDKPLRRYDFAFFDRFLDGFLAELGIGKVALGVHDIGGPIALHWALNRLDRLTGLALLNTLVYPEFSEEAIDFVRTLLSPDRRAQLTGPEGLAEILRAGVADGPMLSDEVIAAVRAPFVTEQAQRALAAAGSGLSVSGFEDIARLLPEVAVPVRVVYGVRDRLLPDIEDTVAKLRVDLPHAEITSLPDNGHFIQEESPAQVAALLTTFFTALL
ncbi:alpha/beta fold hydrolase [Pseudonocardia spinosispora]|uniref:alpha/beta fold hydrolase n=1 Tax=Pseudonocardia spinosispora TaxID=103441 RepID=UPI0004020A5D|nr:alpha/beta fold hydrolase [Pseudonocardia spinosispora]